MKMKLSLIAGLIGFLLLTQSAFAQQYQIVTLQNGLELEVDSLPLAENEGYLILDINPELELKRVELKKRRGIFNAFVIRNVNKKKVYIVRLKVGEYYFSKLRLPDNYYIKLDLEYRFHVEPGVINYPGEFVIEKAGPRSAYIKLKNRLVRFTEDYGEYLTKEFSDYRIKYQGTYEDFYTDEVIPCCTD